MIPATEIRDGAWTARFGGFLILIKNKPAGWAVKVWKTPIGDTTSLGRQVGAASALDEPAEAVKFACDTLRRSGVQILINGERQSIDKFLSFAPAPHAEDVSA